MKSEVGSRGSGVGGSRFAAAHFFVCAARRARSRAEFVAKLGIVEEECDETIYWMEMIQALKLLRANLLLPLTQEANELLAIIVTAIKTTKTKKP